ncbi:MAG: DUF5320 domain-containing protein [Candidatus Lokiarchaeota archaeon]|nr:DUF5320 domain-containing protein [Candidatus Lokiarchaeota archaeon]
MPRRDGTGPSGKGPKTGRGLGNCSVDDSAKKKTANTETSKNTRMGMGRRNRRGSRG